jgi:hypothetical protein
MPVIARNILAVIAGFVIGSLVNMGIVTLGSVLVPPPDGVDIMDSASVAASLHLFETKHFVSPFLAHALGTLAGAVVGFVIARKHAVVVSWIVAALFLAGGIASTFTIPAPVGFIATDLLIAYLPMAYLGSLIGRSLTERTTAASGSDDHDHDNDSEDAEADDA